MPLRAENGETYAVLVVSYEISDRKQAEQALRESEARFRTLTNTFTRSRNSSRVGWVSYLNPTQPRLLPASESNAVDEVTIEEGVNREGG